jgi:hypothetical protein
MSSDVIELSKLRIDPSMRRHCTNNTYAMRGGNHNCTLYVAVECEDLCAFTLTADSFTSRNASIPEPLLLQSGSLYNGTVTRARASYYFLPLTRSQDEVVLALDKQG